MKSVRAACRPLLGSHARRVRRPPSERVNNASHMRHVRARPPSHHWLLAPPVISNTLVDTIQETDRRASDANIVYNLPTPTWATRHRCAVGCCPQSNNCNSAARYECARSLLPIMAMLARARRCANDSTCLKIARVWLTHTHTHKTIRRIPSSSSLLAR